MQLRAEITDTVPHQAWLPGPLESDSLMHLNLIQYHGTGSQDGEG